MKKNNQCFLISLMIVLATSCTNNSADEARSNPANYDKYINGYTSGIVSSNSAILITFVSEIQKFRPGTELPEKMISLKPASKGKTFLIDKRTVEFKPDQPLKQGTKYVAKLNLSELFEVPKELETFNFQFSVIEQDFNVFPGRLSNVGMDEQPLKKYTGKIVTADNMTPENVLKLLSASSSYGNIEVKVIADGLREFIYTLRNIPERENTYTVLLVWSGDPIGLNKKGSMDIRIPSINEFALLQVNVDQNTDKQNIRLIFSDPVDPSQDLFGLIRIEGFEDFKLTRKGAIVTIYPQQRLQGQQTVLVEASLKSRSGKVLNKKQSYVVAMEALKPTVVILGNGVLVPDSRNLILSFKSVSLKAVDVLVYKVYTENIMQFFQDNNYHGGNYLRSVGRPVYRKMMKLDDNPDTDLRQWNAFSVDLAGMIGQDPNAMYRVRFSFRKEYAIYNCGVTTNNDLKNFEDQQLMAESEKSFWDGNLEYYWDYPENYNWRDHDNPCTDSYYTPEKFPQRNILASNLGVIAKSADNSTFTVAVTDLLTTAPVSMADVEFYNFQQQKLSSVYTGVDGMAEITLDEVPYILLVRKDGQQSWLRLDDGSSLSVSNFDVSGEKINNGIKGMVYGERGVWRPGDTLFLTFVMDDMAGKLPKDQPVIFELFNARGQLSVKEVKKTGMNGFYTFRPVTHPEAPTGNWKARVRVGGATFEKSIKIETVKPNRLKINLDFNNKILAKDEPDQNGYLKVKWLHGADASNLKAKVNLKLLKSNYKFEGFKEYTFTDPTKYYYPADYTIFDEHLNNDGFASFPINMYVNSNAPGMLRAVFTTRVFEQGGDFSTDVFSVPFAPTNRFVGIHVPEGGDYKNMLTTDTTHLIEVVTVNKDGNLVSVNDLNVIIYKISWRWWWSSGDDNLASWTRGEDANVIMQQKFSTKNGKARLSFKIDYPDWGRYFIQVIDTKGGHSTGIPVYVDWPSYINRKDRVNPAGATILSVSTDREKYEPGEKAKISFPGSVNSRALISLENGSEILDYFWVTCTKDENTFEFNITSGMAPNIYVYVTLLQPHANTANDLPIRLYGVVPIAIEDPETILEPIVDAPKEVRPQSSWTVEVKEKTGKPMTYTLAVVDEGLLDLTRYKTPDPWKIFYAREALGVKTWDLFDEVLGAFGGRLQKVLAIGGDQEKTGDEDKKANRFKSVIDFLGPFTLNKNQKASHQLNMPNYVGSVKVMVVAGYNGAWGSTDAIVAVKQPLMILPTAPRIISQEEEFDLPVAIFAMNDKIKKVNIKIESTGPVAVVGQNSNELSFEKAGEKMTYFKLAANKMEGLIKLSVSATSDGETASAQIELDVRNPNLPVSRVETLVLDAGISKTINFEYFGMEGTNSGVVEVSGLPSINLEKNLRYLIQYPYGCLEQITSSAFAQLYLDKLTEMDDNQKQRVSLHIRKAINKITKFQLPDGSLSYWPGRRIVSEWSSIYAGHFLILAGQKGFLIPSKFKNNWLNYEYSKAANFVSYPDSPIHDQGLIQAYRLYVLALAGQPNLSAMNRLRENNNFNATTAWRLASAYLLAGMPEAAEKLTQKIGYTTTEIYQRPGITFGSVLRDRAMILETLIMMDKEEEAFELATKMATEMSTGYLSTQTAAYSLFAMARFADVSGSNQESYFAYTLNNNQQEIRSSVPFYKIEMEESENQIHIKNLGNNKMFITKTISGRPLQGIDENEQKNLQMVVRFQSIDGKEIEISNLKQGTDFDAVVKITNPGMLGNYKNLALSQIFPSGWEILNIRYSESENTENNGNFDYRDIRDDRVLTFFNLQSYKSVTFKVSLNAAYTGKFFMPGVSCEAMYDNTIYARHKGKWVNVVRK